MAASSDTQARRIPPPLVNGTGALDAASVLEENPGDLGVLLWKTVRTLCLWAQLPAGDRACAFGAAAYLSRRALILETAPANLTEALLMAADVLRPGTKDSARLALACRQVSQWADDNGAIGTAAEFAQAAALTNPSDADHAHAAAQLMWRQAEYARAEMWYRTAIQAAQANGDWRVLCLSRIGLGIVFVHQREQRRAEKAFLQGLHCARRHTLPDLATIALHELASLAVPARTGHQIVKTEQPG